MAEISMNAKEIQRHGLLWQIHNLVPNSLESGTTCIKGI